MKTTPEDVQGKIDLHVCGTPPWPLVHLYIPEAAMIPVLHGIAQAVAQTENLTPEAAAVLARNLVQDFRAQLDTLIAIADGIKAERPQNTDVPF